MKKILIIRDLKLALKVWVQMNWPQEHESRRELTLPLADGRIGWLSPNRAGERPLLVRMWESLISLASTEVQT